MCLNIVDTNLTKKYQNRKKPITGYKLVESNFMGVGENFFGPILYERCKAFCLGTNISTDVMIETFDNDEISYPSGFHCFTSKKSASKYISDLRIIKVFINPEHIVAVGIESGHRVIVSKQIEIKSFEKIKP